MKSSHSQYSWATARAGDGGQYKSDCMRRCRRRRLMFASHHKWMKIKNKKLPGIVRASSTTVCKVQHSTVLETEIARSQWPDDSLLCMAKQFNQRQIILDSFWKCGLSFEEFFTMIYWFLFRLWLGTNFNLFSSENSIENCDQTASEERSEKFDSKEKHYEIANQLNVSKLDKLILNKQMRSNWIII